MRAALVSALLIGLTTVAHAQSKPVIDRIEIVEAGIYDLKDTGDGDLAFGTSTGMISDVEDMTIVEKTTTIPAKVGVSFGYYYRIIGKGRAEVSLRDVNIVPPPGLRNPDTGKTMLREEAVVTNRIGDKVGSAYTLGAEWELVPGVWTFELWDGKRKLAEQKFTLVKP